jgi:imidazoleglycerol phosphate synthase glutamine amidotransferase subunit HisH
VKFDEAPDLKIPHMGWSALSFPRPTKLFAGLEPGAMVYFVHSYHVLPDDPDVVPPRVLTAPSSWPQLSATT